MSACVHVDMYVNVCVCMCASVCVDAMCAAYMHIL